jgi:predicted DNA-binding transcriptional regulator YafY
MNRTDRLLAIVLELQAQRQRRAEDLAATFEVSKRTIYRDILALCEAGVPVISTPGRGYELAEGYFLPPLRFTADEAVMLLLGSDVMIQSFDAEYRAAAESAARKIGGALPEATRAAVAEIQAGLRIIEIGDARVSENLRALRRAILARKTVQFRYTARRGADGPGSSRLRDADPYGLARINMHWILIAHCHVRGGIRNFRLSRIADVRLTGRVFERPPDFRVGPHDSSRDTLAEVLFAPEAALWVRESGYFYIDSLEDRPDGLLVRLRVRSAEELVQWVLGWGRHARVLAPESLRRLIAAEAEAVLAHARSLLP